MTKFVFARQSADFFDGTPYPLDMEKVEERDGYNDAINLVSKIAGAPRKTIVDLGCGHGRHIRPLSRLGHSVVGVDLSSYATRRARARAPDCLIIRADNRDVPLKDRSVDIVVCLYTSAGYIRNGTKEAIAEAARILRRGGKLIIDLANNQRRRISAGYEYIPGGIGLWLSWTDARIKRQYNLALSRAIVGFYCLEHEVIGLDMLLSITNDADWKRKTFCGDFNGSPFTEKSKRLIMIVERN